MLSTRYRVNRSPVDGELPHGYHLRRETPGWEHERKTIARPKGSSTVRHNPASKFIQDQQRAAREALPFADTRDFENAERGLIAEFSPGVVHDAAGRVVWDNDGYRFLEGEAPDTVHPSLWRQSQLSTRHGLFEVVAGIYQLRGFDLSNMTIVEGDSGIIVIDTLLSAEPAAAALALYREHRGDRPVVAVIHTHSHADHFGGVLGVTSQAEVDAGTVRIIAPAGFVEHAVSENVYVGTAMNRRASYMYGPALERGPEGQVGCGLGQTVSTGEVGLIAPTLTIEKTGEVHTIDGIEIEFQLAPGTEAPPRYTSTSRCSRLCAWRRTRHTRCTTW